MDMVGKAGGMDMDSMESMGNMGGMAVLVSDNNTAVVHLVHLPDSHIRWMTRSLPQVANVVLPK
jgi:hypothetical protein